MGLCASSGSTQPRQLDPTTVAAILATCAPVIVTLNALLIAAFIATKQVMLNTSNFLITCQSLMDMLIGAIAVPLTATVYILPSENCLLKTTAAISGAVLPASSWGISLLIVVDIYLHMNPDFRSKPSKLAKFFERPRIYCSLVVTLAMGCAVSISILCYLISWNLSGRIIGSTAPAILLSTVVAIYVRGYLRIRNYTVDNPVFANQTGSSLRGPRYLHELYKTVLLLVLTHIAVNVPFWLTSTSLLVMQILDESKISTGLLQLHTVAKLFMFSATVSNTLVIFYRNKKAKDWVLDKICCCSKRPRRAAGLQDIATVSCSRVEPLAVYPC